jgi:hypothetical protein
MTSTDARPACSVCSLVVEAHMEAFCNTCGELYHLNSRADLPGDDCGQVWINEEHLSLQFACNTCLNPAANMDLDEVVDLVEAAQAANLDAAMLEAAATAGRVRSRRTAGGALLFRLGDVLEFARERA